MKKIINYLKYNSKNLFNDLKDSLEPNNNTLSHKRHRQYYQKENRELLTGIVVLSFVVLIIFAICYYFLVFSPSIEELNTKKTIKINEVNTIFKNNTENIQAKHSIIAQINSATTQDAVESIDVESLAYPILKNQLHSQINEFKDKYARVEVDVNDTKNIMSVDNATTYINSEKSLTGISIHKVDSVIVPLSINRKQAASGLLNVGDVVDIYNNIIDTDSEEYLNNTDNISNNRKTNKLVGGARIVSILRSKDSGVINYNMELDEYPNMRNLSQKNVIEVEEVLSSKAIGVLDESQLNLLLTEYGTRLSDYERTSNLGNLDVEYIIMVEIPRDSVVAVISNMNNIILTIPTYNAPLWVDLKM